VSSAGLAVESEGRPARFAEVLVEHSGDPVVDDVDRPGDRIRGDRKAARVGLEHHHTKGVGEGGEDEDIGPGVVLREILAGAKPGPPDLGIITLEGCACRSVADHDLGTR
jgi:hypothetical protein